MRKTTPQQKAEAELTKFGLSLPETSTGPGWATTRVLKVRSKMFVVLAVGTSNRMNSR